MIDLGFPVIGEFDRREAARFSGLISAPPDELTQQVAVLQSSRHSRIARPPESQIPDEWFPEYLQEENQGGTSTCCANAGTTVAEIGAYIAGRGLVVQLSRRFLYWFGKQLEGTPAWQDKGLRIETACLVAHRMGICLESTVPWYPRGEYAPGIPNEAQAKEEARKYMLGRYDEIATYDELDTFVTSGQGAVLIGLHWTTGLRDTREEFLSRHPGGGWLGGHAVAIAPWKKRGGERWYGMVNSHAGWGGRRQVKYFSPGMWDAWLRERAYGPARGWSDMAVPKLRPMDWGQLRWGAGNSLRG